MNRTKYTLSILLLTASTCYHATHATELTVFAYLNSESQMTKQLLAKIIFQISASDTLASIKQKIWDFNKTNNNLLHIPDTQSADQLPSINHMSRTQSPLLEDEITTLHKQRGASFSIIFSEGELLARSE